MQATPVTHPRSSHPYAFGEKPQWCGICDKRTLLILVSPDPDNPARDFMVRCEICSPLDGRGSCGKHVQPPGQTCGLCENGIPGRNDPKNPAPHEPLRLVQS